MQAPDASGHVAAKPCNADRRHLRITDLPRSSAMVSAQRRMTSNATRASEHGQPGLSIIGFSVPQIRPHDSPYGVKPQTYLVQA